MAEGMGVLKARVGGQWVVVASGGGGSSTQVSEVEISANDPIALNPNAELWYDSDALAQPIISDEARWNTAWGIVGKATMVGHSGTALVAAASVEISAPMNVNLVAGRRYRIAARMRATTPAGTPTAANLRIQGLYVTTNDTWSYINASYVHMSAEIFIDATASGPATYSAFISPQSYTINIYDDQPVSFFIIEDVGPVSLAAGVPNPTPGWINVTFQNGWVNYGGGFQTAQYRKIGDIVYLRGLVASGTAGSVIFTLPDGYRPPGSHIFAVDCANSAHGRCDVHPTGTVAAVAGAVGYYSISGIQFSVTA